MNRRIQSRVFAFDELEFPIEPNTRIIVLKVIRFASIIIVGFDATIVEVKHIVVGVIHVGFFMKTIIWLKTSLDVNGR